MMNLQNSTLIYFLLLSLGFNVNASPKYYKSLLKHPKKTCSKKSKCILKQPKDQQKFRIYISTQNKNKMSWIQSLTIKSKVKTMKFSLKDKINGFPQNEKVNLFMTDLNQDGYRDIALKGSFTARLGSLYYHWIYNPKTKTFVFHDEMIPPLKKNKRGLLESTTSDDVYALAADYKLTLLEKSAGSVPKTKPTKKQQ